MGQGQGSSLLSGILGIAGGGGAGAGIASSAAAGDFAGAGVGLAQTQGPGILDKIATVLKDPEVLKALGSTASKLGSTIASADKIPPQAHDMFAQVVAQAQAQQQGAGQPTPEDLGMLTPQLARTILEQMGIPGGFRPLTPPTQTRGY